MASRDDIRSPDLQKLEEKVRKDPASKLFFPLAEEYSKAGRLHEAIALLRSGIKAHPDFLGARVALGKALLSKGHVADAKREFEQVVTANPDNLMAHKKLAAIYAKEGDKRKALASCEVILAINPTDAEAVRLRTQVGSLPDVSPEDEATVRSKVSAVPSPDAEATVVDQRPELDESVEPTVVEPTLVANRAVEPEIAEATEIMQLSPATPEAPAEPPLQGSPNTGDDDRAVADEELASVSLADLYVAQGHYQRGIAVYRRILERTPSDAEIAAKLENALTLERLLAPQAIDAEAVKSDLVHHVLAGDESTGAEPESTHLASLTGAAVGTARHQAAIQRLEVWLTRIAERRRR